MKRSAGSRGLMENWLKNCNKKTVTLSDRCETDSEQPNIETGSVIDIRSNAGHPNRLQSTASASSSTSSNDNLKITSNLSLSHNHPPAQPIISEFPVKNGRRFNPEHYKIFRWLEYSIEDDSVYCYACRHFCRNTVFAGQSYGKVAFVDYGVSKWRDIKSILQQHSVSQKHISSMTFWTNATAIQNKTSQNIANTLNENRACDVEDNRRHVRWLIKATCFLGRQGLAFRGKDESENSRNKGNFIELLEIFSDEDKRLKEKLSLRYGHYTSPEYQNDLIATVGALTRQSILDKMSSHGFFSILVDESKDISKKEQLSFVLRFVDKLGNVQERALGCYHMKKSDAASLSSEIINIMMTYKLDLKKCIAQSYDGASVMSGALSGVQKRIRDVAPNAIYVHCHAHRLNLCLIATVKHIKAVSDFFDIVQNLYTFIMNGQTRYEMFVESQKQRNESVIHLERLVDTRWSYWYKSLKKVKVRYMSIKDTLTALSDQSVDKVVRAEATGLLAEISRTEFTLTLCTMESILEKVHALSCELQNTELNIVAALKLVNCTKKMLENMRNDTSWNAIKDTATIMNSDQEMTIQRTRHSRQRKYNSRLTDYFVDSTIGKNDNPEIKIDVFFMVLDRFISELDRRFLDHNEILNSLIIFDVSSHNEFLNIDSAKPLIEHYNQSINQIDSIRLSSEFTTAKQFLESDMHVCKNIIDIRDRLNALPEAFSESLKLIDLVLTLPVTTATNERFFSSMKIIKSYLRSTTADNRLSDLLVISVESDEVKNIDLDEAVDHFARMKKRRYPLLN